ncbi:hypothetical protein LEN26_014904 [Aphanomyces euteiches]|nr:hypothetical protein LEN26_014904 [Aphanomyces euteiches]KAH9117202.1 hypothetical protein AeMF1_008993 [Aphanomyces euteiches]KAH9184218.1 hypothetical protein AeNC1_013807 [Aphanomyces euteiches]
MRTTSFLTLCLVLFAAIFVSAGHRQRSGAYELQESAPALDYGVADKPTNVRYVPDDNTRHQLYQEYTQGQQQGAKRQSFKSFLKKGLKVGWKVGKFAMGFRRLRAQDRRDGDSSPVSIVLLWNQIH